MKKGFLIFVSVCLISYLLGCFISTSFNIKEWGEFLRAILGVSGVFLGLMAMGINMDVNGKL